MDEQRYVVEITRPVPPEKVGQVAQRIAERLNVPVDRIVTLLDGRMGEVTKPVLADKADAIAEVFAEAGVRVVVAAARIAPPQYEERFGEPPEREAEADGAVEPAEVAEEPEPEPAADAEPGMEPEPELAGGPDTGRYGEPEPEADLEPEPEPDDYPDADYDSGPDQDPDDTVPWGQHVTWGFDPKAAQAWTKPERPGHEPERPENEREYEDEYEDVYEYDDEREVGAEAPQDDPGPAAYVPPHHEPEEAPPTDPVTYTPEPPPAESEPYVGEEEADRLGPSPRPLRVAYEGQSERPGPRHEEGAERQEPRYEPYGEPGEEGDRNGGTADSGYAASTRWTPSPHDPYAFAPEDAPGYSGRRSTPMGPARTNPLMREQGEESEPGRGGRAEREPIGGFYSPEDDEPREGPQLRVYLLWGLAISLLVLILLQFVLAMRVDGAPQATSGAFEAGLLAYRKGDFGGARRYWEPVGDAGHAQAQYLLGFMLQNGLGQPWSNARAANWYRRAANQGHPEAQLALGDLYLRGMGVELDPRVGAAWYASAAVAGHPEGQFEYAKLLLHGTGVERDVSAALAWFEAAADSGHEKAMDYVAYASLNAEPEPTEPALP